MIIWGSRGLELKGPSGRFFCPDCNDERDYRRRKVQRFFTLYFIPLIPLEVVHESVGCLTCKQHFTLAALHYDPRAEREQISQELNQHFRTVLGHFGRMSGHNPDQVSRQIIQAVSVFDGSNLSPDEARAELDRTDRNYGVASRVLAQHMTDRGRELVVQQALDVATVDSDLNEVKRSALAELAATLGMSEAHLRGILA